MRPTCETTWTVRILMALDGPREGRHPFAPYFDECVADDTRAAPRMPSSPAAELDCNEDEVAAHFEVAADTWEQARMVVEDIRQRAMSKAVACVSELGGWTMSIEGARLERDDSV